MDPPGFTLFVSAQRGFFRDHCYKEDITLGKCLAQHTVKKPATLLTFLREADKQMSRNTLKEKLGMGAIQVNGKVVRKHDAPLAVGDQVEILKVGQGRAQGPLQILFSDDDVVVIEKPEGLLSVPSGTRGDGRTALSLTASRLKKKRPLLACHRLDRETSGLLLMATHKKSQDHFFKNWRQVDKKYQAWVHGVVTDDVGEIDRPLYENPRSLSVSVSDGADARDALTLYRVLQRTKYNTLLELTLKTGRKHQIRVHLLDLGHPIVGDPRYAQDKPKAKRLMLHATELAFTHPRTRERLAFKSKAPFLKAFSQ
jgi:23S rRNA pseudouridine1911/1915/1917 synthase